MKRLKFSYNAPFTLSFALIAFLAFSSSLLSNNWTLYHIFSIGEGFSFADPFQWHRLFLHILGHGTSEHLIYNLSVVLLLGPILEEKYGARNLIFLALLTALITAIPMLIVPGILFGSSGFVFALIVLSSYTRAKNGAIPLTFALVSVLFIGQEIYRAFYLDDQIAQFAHILGGIVGGLFATLCVKH